MTVRAHVCGWGKAVPSRVLTNDDLVNMVDTSDEWIRTRTGIRERHIVAEDETTFTLARQAAQQALEVAGLPPTQLELIIVATVTSDYSFPSTACLLQDALGADKAAAFDLSAGCTGFIYGLSIAAHLIAGEVYQNALIIGAETLSRITDWEDRATCVLFGDGAGAVVLQANGVDGGVLSTVLGADGSGGELLILPAGGSRNPPSQHTLDAKLHYLKMRGREVFRFAVRTMPAAVQQVLEKAGLTMDDLSLIIPHQANQRILEASIRALGLSPEKVYSNLEHYGNTSSASIPIALCEAVEEGRIQRDDVVVCVGFGAGLTWGAVALRWSMPLPTAPLSRWEKLRQETRYRYAAVRSLVRRAARRVLALWIKEDEW
ncbi:MAG TPA: ketoacyl-ACP synthase III [Chloroflexi bacterium]|nr:MAG: 3-oxoacyl-ACP synthase [Chloroflexota bacterium]HDD24712.1 ketoacyl-ACP synthase III [Chloroflexota bacterium]